MAGPGTFKYLKKLMATENHHIEAELLEIVSISTVYFLGSLATWIGFILFPSCFY